jgi:hypothetical protein
MDDEQLESKLRRYRVGDADPGLRARVLAAKRPRLVPVTTLDWTLLAAAAVLIVAAVATDPDLGDAAASAAEIAWQAQVEDVAALLGGDDEARAYALMVVPRPALSLTPPAVEEEEQ